MSSFNDKDGQEWLIEITVGTVREVKKLTKLDLMELASERSNTLAMLYEDAETLVNVLYVICKSQAEERGISDEDFGCMFSGAAVQEATEALIEGLIDFFPPRRREVLRKAIDKILELEAAALRKAEADIEAMDADEVMEKALAEMNSGS